MGVMTVRRVYENRIALTGAATWTPASLTNLVARYKADTGRTGSPITALADQSGNGYHLVNNNTVPYSATSGYSSLPAVDFTAANDAALYVPFTGSNFPAVVLPDTTKLSIFVVCRMGTGVSTDARLVALGQGGNADYAVAGNIMALGRQGSSSGLQTYYNSSDIADTAISLDTNYVLGIEANGTTVQQYVNNVAGSSGSAALNLVSPTSIVIGNGWNGSGDNPPLGTAYQGHAWQGAVLEVVIWCNVNATERNNLHTYFTGRGF